MAPNDPNPDTHKPARRLETVLAQAGTHYQETAAQVSSRDVVQPLHLASTYERGEDGLTYPGGFIYSRHANPTRSALEAILTEVEAGAEWTATFASGMAAANAVLQAFGAGSYLIMPSDLYHGVRYLVQTVFAQWGLPFVAVDMADLNAVNMALRTAFADERTSKVLLWMESPSNPLLQVTDIPAVLNLAGQTAAYHGKDFISVADITWLTPYLIHPLELGVDLSLSSGTKFMGGHSDLLAGVVSGRRTKPSVAGADEVELENQVRPLAPFGLVWIIGFANRLIAINQKQKHTDPIRANDGRCGPRPVRRLAAHARAQDAGLPDARALRQRPAPCGLPVHAPRRRARALPGPPFPPRPLGPGQDAGPPGDVREHDLPPNPWGKEGSLALRQRAARLPPRHVAGLDGEPDRAPRVGGGASDHDAPKPRPCVGGDRGVRGPGGGFEGGAGCTLSFGWW